MMQRKDVLASGRTADRSVQDAAIESAPPAAKEHSFKQRDGGKSPVDPAGDGPATFAAHGFSSCW